MRKIILIVSLFLYMMMNVNIGQALDMTFFDKITIKLDEKINDFKKETGFTPKDNTVLELNIFSISDICSEYIQKNDIETSFACLSFFKKTLNSDIINTNLTQLEHHTSMFEILFLRYCNLGSTTDIKYGNQDIDPNRLYCGKDFSKTGTELCQLSFGINTYSNGDRGNTGGYSCFCNSGYKWNSNNTSCIKTENTNTCGLNSSSTSDGKNCTCNTGYVWENANDIKNLNCIKKTSSNSCVDIANGYLGTDNKCYCHESYKWSNTHNKCVKEEIKIETNNLNKSTSQKIDTIFNNIKLSKSHLSDEKKIDFYKKLQTQLNTLSLKQKKEQNKHIINYLQDLVETELSVLQIDLSDLFGDLFSE